MNDFINRILDALADPPGVPRNKVIARAVCESIAAISFGTILGWVLFIIFFGG